MAELAVTFYSVLRMPIADILACARAAERAGFGYVSVAESFYRDGAVLASAIAGATRKIKLGTSVLPIYTRTPYQLAMAMATLHELSGGRVGYLGLGVGYRSRTEKYFHVPIEHPVERMRETVQLIRLLLSGKNATHRGRFFSCDDFPPMVEEPLRVPIYFGSSGSRMLRLAGEIADGVILNSIPTPEHIHHAREMLREGADAAGRDPSRLTVASSVVYSVSPSEEEAIRAAKEDVLFYLGYPEIDPIVKQSGLAAQVGEVRKALEQGRRDRAMELIDRPMLDRFSVYGDRKRCHTELRRLVKAGLDLPIIRVSNIPYPPKRKKRVFLRAIESLRGFYAP